MAPLEPTGPVNGLPERYDVFGTKVCLTTVREVSDALMTRRGISVIIANVHSVMASRRDPALAEAIARADIVTPDGVPLTWALRLDDLEAVRVTGIEVLTDVADRGRAAGIRHYFYGSTAETLEKIAGRLRSDHPGIEIAGLFSPPFRALTDDEIAEHAREISAAGAHIVWVGLGMPKQELWMQRIRPFLPEVSLVGVGAAFDWLAGNQPMAPQWMRDRGLEWLYRLSKEPRRLWRRYIYNNPAYLVLLGNRWLRARFGRRG
ncbi:MAG TPA: WecB/TagA/CpsF family glycosyltransferase [Acidimicrobiia bacterium]|jgi:N-acetylglucosaminyldiphosphoundecaprenol N-acetyl-beta-D-mannosaminyltransferase|nr:WecB/TagA/CpsF family glycosyltransferase [Acidimicrobiia bacterium]